MVQKDDEKCPQCGTYMHYVCVLPHERSAERAAIQVQLAAFIYRCPRHGQFKVYSDGTCLPI
jgi:hypothetical protein